MLLDDYVSNKSAALLRIAATAINWHLHEALDRNLHRERTRLPRRFREECRDFVFARTCFQQFRQFGEPPLGLH